jgi:hypothetical protein
MCHEMLTQRNPSFHQKKKKIVMHVLGKCSALQVMFQTPNCVSVCCGVRHNRELISMTTMHALF